MLTCDFCANSNAKTVFIGVGIAIGIAIELLKTDPDSDSDPNPSFTAREYRISKCWSGARFAAVRNSSFDILRFALCSSLSTGSLRLFNPVRPGAMRTCGFCANSTTAKPVFIGVGIAIGIAIAIELFKNRSRFEVTPIPSFYSDRISNFEVRSGARIASAVRNSSFDILRFALCSCLPPVVTRYSIQSRRRRC